MRQADAISAFLYGELERKMFAELPEKLKIEIVIAGALLETFTDLMMHRWLGRKK